jgi:hypothetical protein
LNDVFIFVTTCCTVDFTEFGQAYLVTTTNGILKLQPLIEELRNCRSYLELGNSVEQVYLAWRLALRLEEHLSLCNRF